MIKYNQNGNTITKGTKLIAHCETSDIANEIVFLLNDRERRKSKSVLDRLNNKLAEILKPIYFPSFDSPFALISEILESQGFPTLNETQYQETKFDGGSVNYMFDLGEVYLSYTYYKMESGRFEVVAYFS